MPFTNHSLWSPNDQNDTHSNEKKKEQELAAPIRAEGWEQVVRQIEHRMKQQRCQDAATRVVVQPSE